MFDTINTVFTHFKLNHVLLIRRLLIPVLLFCGIFTTMAQQKGPPTPVKAAAPNQMNFLKGPQIPKSNLLMKFIHVVPGTIALDSLSIIPWTFSIFGVADSAYTLDYVNATLTWKKRPIQDSVYVVFRVFPYRLNSIVKRFSYDSIESHFLVRSASAFNNGSQQASDNFFNFGNITYNGSFGRGISFGNSQDAVVTSNLNLQISGYLADSIEISAAITDNNIPIQPDGTTAQLNEFDKIFLQFKKKTWALSMGDIDLRENRDYFLNFYKRLQGATFETNNKISDAITNKTLVSGAIAKGKFNSNVIQGLEGNQGPYKLQGASNEIYFVVLAGTEKVFIDGEMLQRGQDQDYTINYNTAEITFTPKRMITSDSRIQVEFEYADRNYLNVNLYMSNETDFKDKLKLRVGLFSNSDARNSPINQTLNADQIKFLSQLGDSVQNAYYPVAGIDTFAAGTIQYKRIDTIYAKANTIVHDSIFVYSTSPDSAFYTLSFALVGQGKGDYIPDLNGVNGNIYIWVAPVNGVSQGQYQAAQFLVTPKTQQVLTIGADYKINKNSTMSVDLARSHYDVNTLSSIGKGADNGYAAKLQFKNTSAVSSAEKGFKLTTIMGYEYVDGNFQPVERLRPVEYYRDWGLPLIVAADNESIYTASFLLTDKKMNSLRYDFASLDRGNNFAGVRNTITYKQDIAGWKLNDQVSLTTSGTSTDKGYYLRPTFDLSKKLSWLDNYTVGGTYAIEHNESHDRTLDLVDSTGFSFTTFQAYLRSPEKNPNNWGLTYSTRENSYPNGMQLTRADRSKNVNLYAQITKNPRHQFRFNATYRNLQIINSKISTQTADNSILGRAEYIVKEWKGMLTGNALYEVGSGQVQKLNYSYVQVPAGTGQYAWIDANGDGIQQLNEFVLAQFPDQALFIRIYTPTDVYIKANYNTLNYSVNINPRLYFDPVKGTRFHRFLTKLSLQSSLQLSKKEQSQGFIQLNPFKTPLNDTSLITQTSVFVNTFSFNRSSSKWGFAISNSTNGGKTFLTYGYETRQLKEWSLRTRWNLSKALAFNTTFKDGSNQLFSSSQNFDSSNYNLRQYSVEPDFTYTHGANFRVLLGYQYSNKVNPAGLGGQKYAANSLNSEFKYNILQSTSIQAKFTYSSILYASVNGVVPDPNSSVGYVILNGLVPGKNYIWSLDITRKLGTNLELSLQYEGRKPGDTMVINTGRASLRALL